LAVICAGLVLGSYGRSHGMSERTVEVVDHVWEFAGYLASSLLFLLLGAQIGGASLVNALPTIGWAVLGGLLGRALMSYLLLPLHGALARWRGPREPADELTAGPIPRTWRPLLWLSGLRGALSIALALSLAPTVAQRGLLALVVYGVVLVTLLGQGVAMRIL